MVPAPFRLVLKVDRVHHLIRLRVLQLEIAIEFTHSALLLVLRQTLLEERGLPLAAVTMPTELPISAEVGLLGRRRGVDLLPLSLSL